MADEDVTRNLEGMDELDFTGWNGADWDGVFAHYHTDDVLVDVHGQPWTSGIQEHIDAMKALVETTGAGPFRSVASDRVWIGTVDVCGGRVRRRWADGDRGEVARRRHRRGVHLVVAA